MIVKMNKLTVLCTTAGRDTALEVLRDLGVLHLAHVNPPAGDDLDRARERLEHVRRALEVIPHRARAARSGKGPVQIVEEIWKLIHARKDLEQRMEDLVHEQRRLEPYGSFDPAAVRRLQERGVTLKLYHCARGRQVDLPDGAAAVVLREDKTGRYFAAVSRGPLDLPCEELRLPERSLERVTGELEQTRRDLDRVQQEVAGYAGDRDSVSGVVRRAEEAVEFLEARRGMASAASVEYLRGFCPADQVGAVRDAAAANGWGLIVDEPEPEDRTPTLIRNPRWVRPIQAVFSMIGILPGYGEIDISAVFLVFLSMFFAILVGDAGYGLVFLGLTLLARRKFPNAPSQPFALITIMSVCTVIWGVMTGSYFGMASIPAPLARLKVAWLGKDEHIMLMCFYIGAIHLTIAHLWNMARTFNSLRALAQAGWICTTWTMFFAARAMVLGYGFPAAMYPVFAAGLVLIVLFMTPPRELRTEWFNHVMLPLTLVSNFVDVVSYLRLFAVGTASYAVASSFNAMIWGGVKGPGSALVAAVVLFAGHVLNVLLAAMGVLVHGVRLNTLEFSSHIGMQWAGIPYHPFARRAGEPGPREPVLSNMQEVG